ncbi:MAG: metalloregulator ArsR/SmtB family transcription factor [Actinobacteria bacterium]|nr:metalloregulator ArsR/SmtB family transcription factor [Actinomycetota bacterium]
MVQAPVLAAADPFKALADPTRWAICERLAAEELCVCHLVDDMGLSQSLLSHHLKVLRDAGLLEQRRHSYWTYYRLNRDAFAALGARMSSLSERACEPGNGRPCC